MHTNRWETHWAAAQDPEHGALAWTAAHRCHQMMNLLQGVCVWRFSSVCLQTQAGLVLPQVSWGRSRQMSCQHCWEEAGSSYLESNPDKGLPEWGDARGWVPWQLLGRTCHYTFDANHWVDRAALSSVVILPAAGFPMMSTAIRIEQGINSYPDASLSWELALIRMSWGRVALAPRALLSPGCSHQARSLAIYSQALISQMLTFQISNVSLLWGTSMLQTNCRFCGILIFSSFYLLLPQFYPPSLQFPAPPLSHFSQLCCWEADKPAEVRPSPLTLGKGDSLKRAKIYQTRLNS